MNAAAPAAPLLQTRGEGETMKRYGIGLLAGMLFLSGATAGSARDRDLSFTIVEVSSEQEKVLDVDLQKRTVVVEDEEGKVTTVLVGPEVANFNRVQRGDIVTMELNEHISVSVRPGPGDTMNIGSETQTSAAPGEKPSSIRIIEGKLKTPVEAIDYQKRTITFKGRRGVMETHTIGPEVTRMNEIRPGDLLIIEYAQTIAVSVQ